MGINKLSFKMFQFDKILILLLSLILFNSCKTATLVQGTNLKKKNTAFLLKKLEENRLDYDWFSAKAKVKFEGQGQNVLFTTILRLKTDSIVWMKVQKISIEGMRVRMDKDKVEVLNRQDNQYILESFESLSKKMPLSLQLKDIEDLLVGNPLMKDNIVFESSIDNGMYLLEGEMNNSNMNQVQSNNVKVKLWMNQDFQLSKLYAKMDQNTIEASFADYQMVDGKTSIPFEKDIKLEGPESGIIRMKINFNSVELNQVQDFKFEVPEHYEQVIEGKKINKN